MSRLVPVAAGAAACLLLFGVGFAGAASAPKVVLVSRCAGSNAEPEQAVAGHYVYEAWIGCQGIGFARSVNGGKKFGASHVVPSTGHLWDPDVAVGPDGTVYVSYMLGSLVPTSGGTLAEMTPAVAVSTNHGQSFARVSLLPVPLPTTADGNWGDRDFIAVAPDGTVYVTWDYGPSESEVKTLCDPTGSCAFSNGDFNAVVQKSTDGGKTWTMPAPVSPGFPLGGAYSAPIVVEPNGSLGVLYWGHSTNPSTLAVGPGTEYFTSSSDGGTTWSSPVAVDPTAGTIAQPTWWIDGSLAVDPSGALYATWDTQTGTSDTGWVAWSNDGGKSWSPAMRVTSGSSERLVQVTAAKAGSIYVGWQTPTKGYGTYLRRLAVGQGWTGRTKKLSNKWGSRGTWPGDTIGLSTSGGTAIVSWGSSGKIYATRTALPAH